MLSKNVLIKKNSNRKKQTNQKAPLPNLGNIPSGWNQCYIVGLYRLGLLKLVDKDGSMGS